MLRGMAVMKYDAINLGEKDLAYGREYLEKARDEFKLPFVSANVYRYGTDDLFADEFVIKQVGDLKIGIFGVATNVINPRMLTPDLGFEIKEPIAAAKAAVSKLRGQCDVIVALSHLGLSESKRLAEEVPGIDIVVSGHGYNRSHKPEMVGGTAVMQAGSKGKYLGQINFDVADGKVAVRRGKSVSLNAKIPDDPKQAELVKEFDEAMLKPKAGTN